MPPSKLSSTKLSCHPRNFHAVMLLLCAISSANCGSGYKVPASPCTGRMRPCCTGLIPRAARTAGRVGPTAAVLSDVPRLAAAAPATGAGGGLPRLAWPRQVSPAPTAPATTAAPAGARSALQQPGRRLNLKVLAAAEPSRNGSTRDKSSKSGGRAGSGGPGGGRWDGGGRTSGGGDSSGSGGGRARGSGSARDPADDLIVCHTLEDLQAVIEKRLAARRENLVSCLRPLRQGAWTVRQGQG